MNQINHLINQLIHYGLKTNLIQKQDIHYTGNRFIQLFKVDEFTLETIEIELPLVELLNQCLNYAYEHQLIEQNSVVFRDLFDTEIMNCLMPKPSEVNQTFWQHYKKSKKNATDYFYQLSIQSNYIREDRIKKNLVWKSETKYGDLDITINLSKPEKDPIAIAMAKNMPKKSYPKCLLCRENEGFIGNINHPARGTHRVIGLELNQEEWFLQYSPYVYYNEHCIVLKGKHEPMLICKDTFARLLDFVELFPHYFIGSNADLPIVGGSILDHDHFQGGHYDFAMTKARFSKTVEINEYPDVEAGMVKWPLSVLRLRSKSKERLIELADLVLHKWRNYSDESVGIFAYTEETPHNTITPIARFKKGKFELDLVLRNNRTSDEHPLGIYHPHAEHHHLKKENIGLIEVMGLAVLPARLEEEMKILKDYLVHKKDLKSNEDVLKHADWASKIQKKYSTINQDNVEDIIKNEIGIKFAKILEHCGVFKRDKMGQEAFLRFINTI